MNTVPCSLYIHFPWCIQKCPYCDFNSYAIAKNLDSNQYIDSLIADLKADLHKTQHKELISIFIGGGTPSILQPSDIDKLLNNIQRLINLKENIEITMEANPGTFKQQNLVDFYSTGINRLSIGIQSFQDDKLKALGRIHDSRQATQAIEMAIKAKFSNINLDIMHGLPQQTVKDAFYDLQTAMQFQPQHISWYQLTIEPNTLFYSQQPDMPAEETIAAIQKIGINLLHSNHYQHYEISNYAQPDYECKHNINYWIFGDYFGIGAGAHSKLTNLANNEITRYWKHKNPINYLDPKNNFIAGGHTLAPQELPLEFMMNALRLYKEIPLSLFTKHTGLNADCIAEQLTEAQKQGFLEINNAKITTTELGKNFLNKCLEIFAD